MKLLDVDISAQETFRVDSPERPLKPGRKYAVTFEAMGLGGIPLSGYLAAVLLDADRREIDRKVRWLNDMSGDLMTYRLVFKAPEAARSILLVYRINCEWAVKFAWRGKLADPAGLKVKHVRDKTPECFDDLLAWRTMLEAADLARNELSLDKSHMDLTPEEVEIVRAVKPFTLTSNERLLVLMHAVRHVIENNIPGDVVECGVWKGGSMMAAALALMKRGATRDLWLYDTFTGMTAPSAKDVDVYGQHAGKSYETQKRADGGSDWCAATLDEVKKNLSDTKYPAERVHFVPGRVEEAIPATAPREIAILRLDTDFYESTKHELTHLYPRLARGGVLIVDDYGYWQGARQAVDEYLRDSGARLFLARIDNTGRVAIKP